jgi:iron complex transport system permease protein
VRRLRLALLLGACAATGLAVASAGAIGFVGLVVPQALRLAGVRTRDLAWMSAIGGAALLAAADLALLGAPISACARARAIRPPCSRRSMRAIWRSAG